MRRCTETLFWEARALNMNRISRSVLKFKNKKNNIMNIEILWIF